ncbi:MAG: hypothetical protein GY889_07720 [Proteobacteria bacterium]|nr:hypothetical protein [Pseudomonadota bacterium]
MATSTSLPPLLVAGQTLKFIREYGDYLPADGWTATTHLTNSANSYTVTAADNGDGRHLFTASKAVTALWVAGDYKLTIVVDDGSEGYTAEVDTVKVDPALGAATDMRSHARKVLDALEATLEGKASSDQLSYSIRGRSLSRMSPGELLDWRDRYKVEWQREVNAERIANGLGTSAVIRVRF